MESNKRKFVLRTTCLKNGGFRKYQLLPPQEVFQHAYWVLSSEMDVKVKRKQTLFNRETEWRCLPVYLTTNKGLLFVYMKNDAGYVLRVPSASRVTFDGTKKMKNKKRQQESGYAYSATIMLHFHFGELHLRFNDSSSNLSPWRSILMAAHDSENGLAAIGEQVAKEVFGSTSLESVVSTKSVVPDADDKDKAEKVVIHRHAINPCVAPAAPGSPNDAEDDDSASTSQSSTSQQTASEYSTNAVESVSAQSPKDVAVEVPSTIINQPRPTAEAASNESVLEYSGRSSISRRERPSKTKSGTSMIDTMDELDRMFASIKTPPRLPSSERCVKTPEACQSPFASHVGTSEVDVSCKDFFAEDPDTVSDTSITAAFKTSPVTTRQSAASLFGSTKSFCMDNNENAIVADMPQNNHQMNTLRKLIAQFEETAPQLPPVAPPRLRAMKKFEESVKKFEGIGAAPPPPPSMMPHTNHQGKTVKFAPTVVAAKPEECMKKFSGASSSGSVVGPHGKTVKVASASLSGSTVGPYVRRLTMLPKPADSNVPAAARKPQQHLDNTSFV